MNGGYTLIDLRGKIWEHGDTLDIDGIESKVYEAWKHGKTIRLCNFTIDGSKITSTDLTFTGKHSSGEWWAGTTIWSDYDQSMTDYIITLERDSVSFI